MTKIVSCIHDLVWGAPTLVLILGVGLYLSLCTGFAQLRLLPASITSFFSRLKKGQEVQGSVSPFRALCTALAATVGTGNLAGVAGAVAIGGPGSVFWIWVSGIFGMATKFAEATLAVRYRVKGENGEYLAGPMYMISRGLGRRFRFLGAAYCFFGVVAAFGVGNATQINALLGGVNGALAAFGQEPSRQRDLLIALALAVLIGALLMGGAKRIGAAAEMLVPFASLAYILLCVGVLVLRWDRIVPAFAAILQGAFSPRGVTGGIIGSAFTALRVGVSRGVFTNEAGMGTASIAHGAARVEHPAQQGLMGIMEVFLDTIVICTMTALVILVSGADIAFGLDEGILLTERAFICVYGSWVTVPIALFLALFALATVLGWGLYGARCAQYLLGNKAWKPFVYIQMITVVISAVLQTGTVWTIAEIVNGLMAVPNLIALAALSPELFRLTKTFKLFHGGHAADGGTYENFDQCQPLRALSHAKVSPLRCGSGAAGKDHLPSEHRSAGSGNAPGLL